MIAVIPFIRCDSTYLSMVIVINSLSVMSDTSMSSPPFNCYMLAVTIIIAVIEKSVKPLFNYQGTIFFAEKIVDFVKIFLI